jgi:hemoglobin/transferrin/lactoferrin receptor protein
LLILASYLSFFALQDSLNTKPKLLNEVQITANRSKEIQFNSPNSIDIISNKQLKNSALRTTPESISGISGLFLQKTNHGGGSAIIRGLMGNQTLILVDGIRLNNSTFRYGPNQYLNTIEPFSIERIEVLKGNGSVQYGTDAMGGTIHIITESPEFNTKLKANILSRWASHDMEKTIRPQVQFGSKNIAFSSSFSLRKFGDLLGGKNIGIQSPTGYNERAINLKTKLKLINLGHRRGNYHI